MRDIQTLQQTIENQRPEIHKKRHRSLMLATKAVLDGSVLRAPSIVGYSLSLYLVRKYVVIGDTKYKSPNINGQCWNISA